MIETMLQQKKQIETLEVECNMLQHLVSSLTRKSQSAVSNFRMSIGLVAKEMKEDESNHQKPKDMDMVDQEAHIKQVFH